MIFAKMIEELDKIPKVVTKFIVTAVLNIIISVSIAYGVCTWLV